MTLTIEICPHEPRATLCDVTYETHQDVLDCTGPGDAEPACAFVRDEIGVAFHIIAPDAAGKYENRLATDTEIEKTARAIYFDSESDFSDRDTAALYLIWQAACDYAEESENA